MANLTGTVGLFAAKSPFQSLDFYLTVGSLVGVLLVGAVILHFVDKWRNKQFQDDDDTPMTLSHYRKLYEQGELSEEEYAKVRDRLAAKMKHKGTKGPTPMVTPTPAPPGNDAKPPKLPDPEAS